MNVHPGRSTWFLEEKRKRKPWWMNIMTRDIFLYLSTPLNLSPRKWQPKLGQYYQRKWPPGKDSFLRPDKACSTDSNWRILLLLEGLDWKVLLAKYTHVRKNPWLGRGHYTYASLKQLLIARISSKENRADHTQWTTGKLTQRKFTICRMWMFRDA